MKKSALVSAVLFFFQAPLWAAPSTVFFDFSEKPQLTPLKLSKAEEAKLIAAVFPKYVEKESDCPAEEGLDLKIVYGVTVVSAQLSASKEDQWLMALNYQPCEGKLGSHSEYALAYFVGGKWKATLEGYGLNLIRTFREKSDGPEQVLVTNGWSGQGCSVTNAETIAFRDGKLVETHLLNVKEPVEHDNCAETEKGTEEVSVFFIESASPLKLSHKNYRKPCGAASSQFKLFSSPIPGC